MNHKFFINRVIIFIGIILSISFFSCYDINFETPKNSDIIEYRYDLGSFDTVQIHGYFNIELVESPEYAIKVKMSRKLIKKFSYHCNDTVLEINKDSNGRSLLHNSDSAHLTILAPNYHYLELFGPSFIYSKDTLHYDIFNIYFKNRTGSFNVKIDNRYTRLELWTSAGNYTLKGKSKQLVLFNGRLSNIFADEMVSENITVGNHALGNIYCHVANQGKFHFEIMNKGNIYLRGTPALIDTLNFREGYGQLILLH